MTEPAEPEIKLPAPRVQSLHATCETALLIQAESFQ